MPDPGEEKKISELDVATTLEDTDEIVIARPGVTYENYSVSGAIIKNSAKAAGSDTEVQFNDGGVLAGGFAYDKTTDTASVNVSGCVQQKYGIWIDKKTVGTDGGTPTAGAWTTRELNYEVANVGSIGVLASNVVTLQAGTYLCEWWSPFSRAGRVATRLAVGSTAYAGMSVWDYAGGNYATSVSHGLARFTITEETNIAVVYYVDNAQSTTGLGYAGPSGRTGIGAYEVYTILKCTKEK